MAQRSCARSFYFGMIFLVSCAVIVSLLVFAAKRSRLLNRQVSQVDQFGKLLNTEKRKNTPLTMPILMYHYVEVVTDLRDTIRQSMNVPPRIFEEQLNTFLKNGYTPIRLSDVMDYYDGRLDLPPKPLVLTFDDGYRDFYTDVLPILRRHRIPAVIYVVSGYLDTTRNYLTTGQLLEIRDSGVVEIGAHGVSHRNFLYVDQSTVTYEMKQSQKSLEELLGIPVKHLAYPYGAYSQNITILAEKTGFETAATVERGVEQTYTGRFQLKRIRVGSLLGDAFLELLSRPL